VKFELHITVNKKFEGENYSATWTRDIHCCENCSTYDEMFLFRCCKRVDCGCQSEADAEVSRSSHSTSDYSQQSVKQIQRRLLPQPVVSSHTKHFADYSGCSQTMASRALLVGSTHSVDYEEVLCVSVPSKREIDESVYSHVDENIIRKPPCSVGVVNNNFSPDPSSSNNNLIQPETNDREQLVQVGGPRNGSGSDENSDMSSASSNVDDRTSAEVKYVADIRQFRPTQTSVRPHGDDCCSSTCQSDEGFDRTEDDALVHHSTNLKCSCKSCHDFHSRLQSVCTSSGFTPTAGGTTLGYQYRLMTTIAQDGELISSLTSKSSAVYEIVKPPSFNSQSIQPVDKSTSISANRPGLISGAFGSEEADDDDDDDGLFSSDDELHYVFHKFIDDGCFKEPFTDVSRDDRLRPSEAAQSESGAEVEHLSARSADDLEVAFFMFGDISPANQSTAFPHGSFVTAAIPAPVTDSSEQETAAAAPAEFTADTFGLVTEPSVSCGYENVSTIERDSMLYNLDVVCKDLETDRDRPTGAVNVSSGSPTKLEKVSDVLRIEASGLETDVSVDSDVYVVDDENQQLDSGEVRRDVIVQKLSDTSSFFIELPGTADERVSDDDDEDDDDDVTVSISPSAYTESSFTAQELAPAKDDAVIGQRVEIVTPQCITEHPVIVGELKSSQTANDLSYEFNHQQIAVDVASYICDVVADAVQQIADSDASAASAGVCNIAAEDPDISGEWSQQILVTNASSYHQPTMEDEYGRETDSLPSVTGCDMEPQCTSVGDKYWYNDTGADTVDDANVSVSPSDDAVRMNGIQAQEVPQDENYLISYDAHLLQQLVDENVDQTLLSSSRCACPDETDVELHDLVQPLEHVVSEGEQDLGLAGEHSLDSVDHSTGRHSATQANYAPTDIVEDFFMHYVLPVDSVGYCTVADTAAEVSVDKDEDVINQLELDRGEEDLVSAEALENTAQSIVDIVISDAIAESNADVAVTSAVLGAPGDAAAVGRDEVDQGVEGVVEVAELEVRAERMLDDVISDAVAAADIAPPSSSSRASSSLVAASSDSQLVIPRKSSSCLLHSPPESLRKKSVHFADMHGLQLETVQHYDKAPEVEERRSSLEEFLSKLSAAAAERRAKWTEHHSSSPGTWLCSSSVYLLACFELPGSQEDLLDRVRQCRVALESCAFDDLALAISGVIRVANIAFSKKISVRYSIDHWATSSDIDGEYIPRSNDGPTDRFSFTIILPSVKQFVVGSEVQFAICYVAGDGPSFEFWDNNRGRNYVVRCCSKATSSDAKTLNINTDNDDSD